MDSRMTTRGFWMTVYGGLNPRGLAEMLTDRETGAEIFGASWDSTRRAMHRAEVSALRELTQRATLRRLVAEKVGQ